MLTRSAMMMRNLQQNTQKSKRAFSSSTGGGGSSFIDRIGSFFIGIGVGFGINVYMVQDELKSSNIAFSKRLADIESKLK